jgi:uncharacterized membrane protein YciS (DUF1049 family)
LKSLVEEAAIPTMAGAPHLAAVAAALAVIAFGEFTTAQAVIGFTLGIIFGAALVVAAIIVGLTWAEKKTAASKAAELKSKTENLLPDTVCHCFV